MSELVPHKDWVHILKFKFSQHRAITVTQPTCIYSSLCLAVLSLQLYLGNWATCPAHIVEAIGLGGGTGLLSGQSSHPSHSRVRRVLIGLLIPQNKGSKAKGLRGQRGL